MIEVVNEAIEQTDDQYGNYLLATGMTALHGGYGLLCLEPRRDASYPIVLDDRKVNAFLGRAG
jgi:hypothetical protein